jgi:hypothetical protein
MELIDCIVREKLELEALALIKKKKRVKDLQHLLS